MLTIACVLRSGGDYTTEYVRRLREGITRHCEVPFRFVCLSDLPQTPAEETIPLRHGWPGWWSKIELFAPWIRGDVLYFDLDTIIVGSIDELAGLRLPATLQDVNKPEAIQSSVMWLTEAVRAGVYGGFLADPDGHMARHVSMSQGLGDQGFLDPYLNKRTVRLQDVLPKQLISYKKDVMRKPPHVVPRSARVVFFHGKPKPHEIDWRLP